MSDVFRAAQELAAATNRNYRLLLENAAELQTAIDKAHAFANGHGEQPTAGELLLLAISGQAIISQMQLTGLNLTAGKN